MPCWRGTGPRATKLPAMELLLGAQVGKFPVAPRPDHDISAAAEHRMNLAVRHLKMIGCRASGLISDEDLVKAVRAETRRGDYDGVILATGRQDGSWLAGVLGRDPVHQLRRRWGERLIVFSPGSGAAELGPRDESGSLSPRRCGACAVAVAGVGRWVLAGVRSGLCSWPLIPQTCKPSIPGAASGRPLVHPHRMAGGRYRQQTGPSARRLPRRPTSTHGRRGRAPSGLDRASPWTFSLPSRGSKAAGGR